MTKTTCEIIASEVDLTEEEVDFVLKKAIAKKNSNPLLALLLIPVVKMASRLFKTEWEEEKASRVEKARLTSEKEQHNLELAREMRDSVERLKREKINDYREYDDVYKNVYDRILNDKRGWSKKMQNEFWGKRY